MGSNDPAQIPTWAYEHTVYSPDSGPEREVVLSYNEDDTQLDEDLEIIATEELIRRKDLPQQWICNGCGTSFYWDRNHENEKPTCPDCASTDTETLQDNGHEAQTGGESQQ